MGLEPIGGGIRAVSGLAPGVTARTTQHTLEAGRHFPLGGDRAVIFEREDDGVGRRFEGVVADRDDDVAEEDFRRERMAVVNDGFAVVTVPTVEFHAAATLV